MIHIAPFVLPQPYVHQVDLPCFRPQIDLLFFDENISYFEVLLYLGTW